jgi:6-pyruvoyltetrahydropterin/6-carboxytetrahydropterin synthase
MKFKFERSFSAAHFYKQPAWSLEKNQQEFGKCFTEFGHGHDYKLEITFESTAIEPNVGLIKNLIENLIEKLDHQHLNFTIEEFRTQIPTTENIALYIQKKLKHDLKAQNVSSQIRSLRLQETPEIWVELWD